ncbi:MAG: acyl-homoserine-lactone synthase [Pseudomonadota bacterium]
MLRYLRGHALKNFPTLSETMFRDRATQFGARLNWDVTVDATGAERDAYDALDPIYVIWQGPGGHHAGSMRFLPTTGRTMLAEHFLSLTDGVDFASPHIWETTRFCIAPDAPPETSAALMLGGLELGLRHDWSHAIGVFDARMVRIYRRLGWPPAILGTEGTGKSAISVGLWAFEPHLKPHLARGAGVSEAQSSRWLLDAFPKAQPAPVSA